MKHDFVYPRILECARFAEKCERRPEERIVTDYEIDFNLTGGRTMWVDGKAYAVKDNSLVCKVPGQRVSSIGTYNMYMMTLDFSKSIPRQAAVRHRTHAVQPEFDSYFWDVIPTCFEAAHASDIAAMYRELIYRFNCGEKEVPDSLVASLLHLIVSDAFSAGVQYRERSDAVYKTIAYMTENYAKHLDLDDIAAAVFLNKSYLIRLFKSETGITPIKYLRNIRMGQACLLLKNASFSVAEVAEKCGYSGESYFIANFKQQYGCTPEQYRTGR